MKTKFSKQFTKQYDKAPQKIQIIFQKKIKIFKENQNHPSLKNHKLKGKFNEYYSINVTGDWRALFRKLEKDKIIFFDFLGTHSQLYK